MTLQCEYGTVGFSGMWGLARRWVREAGGNGLRELGVLVRLGGENSRRSESLPDKDGADLLAVVAFARWSCQREMTFGIEGIVALRSLAHLRGIEISLLV